MIPIKDYPGARRRTFPYVMIGIIVLNVLVFLYELLLGPDVDTFINTFGTIPYEISHGVDIPPKFPGPVYLTLITSMFIHGGFLHIGFNMLFLWIFGDNVEDALGHMTFLAFYLVTGIIAGLAQVLVDPSSTVPGIGASGAIAGVMAAYLILFPHAQVRVLLFIVVFVTITRISAFLMIGVWFLLQLFSGLASLGVETQQSSGVAFWAHVGGFISGLVLAKLIQAVKD